jgi:hypothetical protein
MIAGRTTGWPSHLRRGWLTTVVVSLMCLWAAPSAQAARRHDGKPKLSREALAASFETFCAQWMERIHNRSPQSVMRWEKDGEMVQGTYVEYSTEYSCALTDQSPTVGRIAYRETWYEKRGKTIDEAARSSSQPIEIVETREFFSYSNGRWTY